MSRRKLLLSVVSNQDVPNNQIWYTTSTNNITSPEDDSHYTVISNTYENGKGILTFDKDLTTIYFSMFRENSLLTSIMLPESITTIDVAAFQDCTSLESIKLPKSLTTINSGSFANTKLRSFHIPEKVTKLNGGTFSGCTNLQVVNTGKLEIIGNLEFDNCTSLNRVILSPNLKKIGDKAFFRCGNLYSIYLPESLEEVGVGAFSGCYNLRKFEGKFASEDGRFLIIPTEEGNKLTSYALGGIDGLYELPENVDIIGKYAFYEYAALYIWKIYIPENIRKIEEDAFYSHHKSIKRGTLHIQSNIEEGEGFLRNFSIGEVYIEDNVTTIKNKLFSGALINSVTIGTGVQTIGDNAFENIEENAVITFNSTIPPTLGSDVFSGINNFTIEIPEGYLNTYLNSNWEESYKERIKDIGNVSSDRIIKYKGTLDSNIYPIGEEGVLYHSNGKIVFSNTVTEIIENKFKDQTGLNSITLPSSLRRIKEGAFYDCTSLKGSKSMLPESLSEIEEFAFYGCSNLGIINIPNSVINIGNCAFSNCNSLIVKCFCQLPPIIGDYTFHTKNSEIKTEIWILQSKYKTYTETDKWKDYIDHFVLMDNNGNRVQLNNEIWYKTVDDKKLTLQHTNYKTHTYSDGVGVITFNPEQLNDENLTKLPDAYFKDCSTLKYVSLPNTVTTIGDYAFENCTNLRFKKEEENIGGNTGGTVRPLAGMTPILPGEGISGIPGSNSSKEIAVELPTSIITIGRFAFSNCVNLKELTLPNITYIDHGVFNGCVNLEKVSTDKLKELGIDTFKGCIRLKSIDLSKVEHIGDSAFEGCTALIEISLYNVKDIGTNAFNTGGDSIIKVHINNINDWCRIIFGNYYSNPTHNGHLYANGIEIKGNIEITSNRVRGYSFVNSDVTSVDFKNSTVYIEENAFSKKLQSINIFDSAIHDFGAFRKGVQNTNIFISNIESFMQNNSFLLILGKKTLLNMGNVPITDINLDDSSKVVKIADYAFYNCNITTITISRNAPLERIGISAFDGCPLSSITCLKENPPEGGTYMFGDPDNFNADIKVSDSSKYGSTDVWSDYI